MWENYFIVATQFVIEENVKDLAICFVLESHIISYIKKACFLMFSH
jgi:hypothetical protein